MEPTWLAISAMWAGVFCYGISTLREVAEQFAPAPEPITNQPFVVSPSDIPEDLMAIATQETESWAQEEMVRVIQERYETLRDWNRVRSSMGVGIIPEHNG